MNRWVGYGIKGVKMYVAGFRASPRATLIETGLVLAGLAWVVYHL